MMTNLVKFNIALFLFALIFNCHAQKNVIHELSPEHKSGIPKRETAYTLFDSTGNKLYLTFITKKKIYFNVYQNFQKTINLKFDRTEDPGLFSQINLGSIQNDKFSLLLSNPTCATFSIIEIDIKNSTIERRKNIINLKDDELFLHSFSKNGDFHVVTILKKSSLISLYKFDTKSGETIESTIDFGMEISKLYKNTTVWEIIKFKKPDLYRTNWYGYFNITDAVAKLDPDVLIRELKFLVLEDKLIILIDNYQKLTLILTINLITKQGNSDFIMKPKLKLDPDFTKSNSFVFEDKLFQVKVSYDSLKIRISSILTKEVLAEYLSTSKDIQNPYNSSPISDVIRSISVFGSAGNRENIKVKKLLQPASVNGIFIGAFRNKQGNLEIYIGSNFYITSSVNGVSKELISYTFLVDEQNWHPKNGTNTKKFFDSLFHHKCENYSFENAQTVFEIEGNLYFGCFETFTSLEDFEATYYNVVELE